MRRDREQRGNDRGKDRQLMSALTVEKSNKDILFAEGYRDGAISVIREGSRVGG